MQYERFTMYSENDYRYYSEDELAHYGIMGQKWGIRNYQNPDGTLTEEGKKRYGTGSRTEFADRMRRSEEAAKQETQINRLSGRRPSERIVNKIDKLSEARNKNISNLTDEEISLGRRFYSMHSKENAVQSASVLIGGMPGYLTSLVGTALWERTSATGTSNYRDRETAYQNFAERERNKQ